MNQKVNAIISEMDALIKKLENDKKIYKEQICNHLVKINCGLMDVSVTECHLISCIGSEKEVNGIKLADKFGMTRGGISKIIASLIKKELIVSYQDGLNQKKIFYKLTPLGEMINEVHNEFHEKIEIEFTNKISKYSEQEQDIILSFIKDLQE